MAETFKTKKSLGQNFLNSPVVPNWLCDAADLKTGELIFEIGPGVGALTAELLKRGVNVIALEADQRALVELEKKFPTEIRQKQLTLVHGDARKLDFAALKLIDHKFKIVANIPYYLSGLLFRQCLEGSIQPSDIVFLVQKEVAKRACSHLDRGEKESLLSLAIKAYGEPFYVKNVGRGHFTPAPAVDSAIIAIKNINRRNFTDLDETTFFKHLHLGFGQKRKQLLGNLANEYEREKLIHIFSTCGIDLTTRAEDLSLEKWLFLSREITKHT